MEVAFDYAWNWIVIKTFVVIRLPCYANMKSIYFFNFTNNKVAILQPLVRCLIAIHCILEMFLEIYSKSIVKGPQ
jgi:hypothetical protein